mgnify:FL=1
MLIEVKHPCVQAALTRLRDRETAAKEFREQVGTITGLLAFEALRNLEVEEVVVRTPLAECDGWRIRSEVVVVPILRAGLGMLESILRLVPDARVGFIGLERNEITAEPREYYCKLPEATPDSFVLVIDPMLATGGSLSAAIRLLKAKGFRRICVLSILSAPDGVARMEQDHPETPVYTGGLDPALDAHHYIVPGLGDAGDRLFLLF